MPKYIIALTRSRPDHLRQRVVDIARSSAHGRRQQITGAVLPITADVGRHHGRLEQILLGLPLLLLQCRHEEGVGLGRTAAVTAVGGAAEEGPAGDGGPVGVARLEVGRGTEPRGTGRAAVATTSSTTTVGHGHGRLRRGIDAARVEDDLVHHLGRALPASARAVRSPTTASRPHPATTFHPIGLRDPFQKPSLQLAQLRPALLDLIRRQPINIRRPPPKHLLANAVVPHKFLANPHRIAVEQLG